MRWDGDLSRVKSNNIRRTGRRAGGGKGPLCAAFHRRLGEQLRLLDGGVTLLHQVLLVIRDADLLLRQVDDRLVRDLPQILCDLADETCIISGISSTPQTVENKKEGNTHGNHATR
jgi:hypothetical protein